MTVGRQFRGKDTCVGVLGQHAECCVQCGLPWGSAMDRGVERLLPLEQECRFGDRLGGRVINAWV